ncbi:unnamed protein product [Cladocopium goreaui]|uniref:Uncharacterized protein n=1 Tax=Cladocopium goreaui TaxID=2562237 RepID=A0A9P1D5B1_9DINO|nr:unnamed protein product [Cladocopium goreaui]|mmetsp:Transcript_24365/g.53099  ORF Transcript_24365/g.53099 Transcript_24365/m.53099 type:complete len:110 (+) Transcript_24365:30-359(+)
MVTVKKVKGKVAKKKKKGESVQANGQGGQTPSGSSGATEKTQTRNSETSPKKAMKKLMKKATGKAAKVRTKVATENTKKDDGCDLCEGLIPLEGVLRCRSCGRTMAATA